MTYLTIEKLIRYSSIKSISWLCGEDDLDHLVKWVSYSSTDLHEKDLILLENNDITPSFIAKAKKKKVSGVIIVNKNAPKFTLTHNLPIGILTEKHDLRNLQQELITIILNQQVSRLEQRERVHSRLTNFAAEGYNFQDIVQKLHEISGSGIVIQDKYLSILAEFSPVPLREMWNEILDFISAPINLPEPLKDRDKAGQYRAIYTQAMPGNIARYVSPIIVRSVVRGYFSIINTADKLDELDRLVGEEGPFICAIEMSKAKAVRETEKKLNSDLLSALLTDGLEPRETSLWVKEMGLNLSWSHTALQFSWDSESPPSRRRLESLINGEISRTKSKIIINPISSNVVCFFQTPVTSDRPSEAIEFAQIILQKAYMEFPDANLRCGIGSPADSIEEWRGSFRQASQALDMALKLKESKPLYYHDLSVYRLLIQLEDEPDLTKLYRENLGKLLSQNKNHDLISTLDAFFENNQNLTETAKSLFIHRNTLLHRMKRIREISGLDLDNPDTRLAVQLSLRVHRIKGGNIE